MKAFRPPVIPWRERYSDPLLTALTACVALMIFVAAPLHAVYGDEFIWLGAAIVLIMIAGVFLLSGSVAAMLLMLAAFAMGAAAILLRINRHPSALDLYLVALSWLLLSLTLGAVVARTTFGEGEVTSHRIVGAILLYLIIGMIFVSLFTLLNLWVPHAFSGFDIADNPHFTGNLIYFSFVTLTSVGYGDITPVHPFARSFCNVEAICGQLYPLIVIGRLVSLHAGKG